MVHNNIDGEDSKYAGLYEIQDQPHPQRQPHLGGDFVVQRAPKQQGVIGNAQGVRKHDGPGYSDRPQLPKGVEQQVKLQH